MTRVSPAQTNFTAGELSPRLFGREDVQRYSSGVAELQNFRVMTHGGAERRTGTRWVAEVKNSAKATRLLPFEYSVEQAYVLEFGDLYMRVFKDRGQVESSPGVPYELVTEFPEASVFELQYAQTADVMYIAHRNHWPRKLTRTGHTSWAISEVLFDDGPYLPTNTSAITMTPSATTGSITITASAPYFNANMAPVGTEPGAYIRILHGGTWGYAQITGFTSTTQVSATVKSAFGAATAQTSWAEGAWSTHRGFPRAVGFYEERLYFGGTSYQPQTLWGSAVGAYEDFTPGTGDADAVTYTIASTKQTAIQWLRSRDVLMIGTASAEFVAGSPDAPLTPTNVRITPQTTYGSAYIQPVQVGNVVLFVQRSKRRLREMGFEFSQDSYRAPDITLLAEHITRTGIRQLDYAAEPDSMVWAVRSDGVLLGLTYDREQEVLSWARHVTDGLFESVASIPVSSASGTEGYDETWVIVNRTIGGATKRYVEYFAERFGDETDIEDAVFVDSSLAYSGAPTTTLTGLSHLEGKTVSVLGDGAVMPPQTVSAGAIALPEPVAKAQVGLAYTSRIKTLPPIVGAQDGTTQGKETSWGRVKLRLYRTLGLTVDDEVILPRDTADLMGEPLEPYTGIREVQLDGWDNSRQVVIETDKPLPASVLAMFGTLQVEDM